MINKPSERKLIPGRKYLVGPENKERAHYGKSHYNYEVFCNWQILDGGPK